MKYFLSAALFVLLPLISESRAQDVNFANVAAEVRTYTLINQLTAERVLIGVDYALDNVGYVARTGKNSRVIHEHINKLSSRLEGVRAIIVLSEKGLLIHDSFRYPAKVIDLSDRDYFQQSRETSAVVIGDAAIGRTSGVPFIPVAKKVGDVTVVAIVSPHLLISSQTQCVSCVSAILRPDGSVLASFPPAAQIPPNVLSLPVLNKSEEGIDRANFLHSDTAIAWKQSALYPLIVLSAKGLANTARVGFYD